MSVQRIDRSSVKKILDGYVYREHSVMIKFYGANCGYCHHHAPIYKKLADRYDDIHFYAFNMEDGDGFEEKYDFYGVPTICYVRTNGSNTKVEFLPDPETPNSGPDGTWYSEQEITDFIENKREEK